jgi:hypothetical protein
MKFICNKSWEDLTDTDDSNIRYCMSCYKNVYFCESQEDLNSALKSGLCIAYETEFKVSKYSIKHSTLGLPKGYGGFNLFGDFNDKAD